MGAHAFSVGTMAPYRGRSTGAGDEQGQCGAGPGERELSALRRAAGILPVVLPQLFRGLPGGRPALGLLLIFPKHPELEPSLLARAAERHSRRDLSVPPSLY